MPRLKRKQSYWPSILVLLVLIAISVYGVFHWKKKELAKAPEVQAPPAEAVLTIEKPKTVIDYGQIGQDTETNKLMEERKAQLGVGQGIDMIAKPEESLKVGETTVPMQDILEQIRIKEGKVIEKSIESTPTGEEIVSPHQSGSYGIYVVQPGDNIWNIHFKFLQDYFHRKGVALAPSSDEPDKRGFSSGVGKVLKFSENMVHIYNLTEKKLDVDINLIRPLNKIIVYNMDQVFALLDQIDTSRVNQIQFDGETLWVPAEQ